MSATASLPLPADPPPEILYGPVRDELLRDERLADLFEATAARLPQAVALVFGDERISYAELDARASLAASHLIDAGAAPGRVIGLWLTRGIDLLVMQLAIAKTGAAWLPFDAATPVDRIAVCLGDAQALGLIASATLQPKLGALHCPVFAAEALKTPVAVLRCRGSSTPEDPAYLIYTSGSTGVPKGIVISQRSICHFLRSENALLGVAAGDCVYQGFSVAFDMSFEEIWIAYLVGATLWIAPETLAGDPEALPQALIDAGVTVLHAVPTLVALFAIDVPRLRLLNLGGEACPDALVTRWARPGRTVFNTYGPTETTVSASLAVLKPGQPVTIGQPLPNYTLMVVEPDTRDRLALLPRGSTGELCVGGPGVALGYSGRPELTAEKFVTDPERAGGRVYRTGDLAAIDETGNVRFYGRVDDQIKIRGFRVELGEIEVALTEQPGVTNAAVVLRQDQGIDQLVAFYLNDPQAALPPTTVTLRTALAERLPPYMVPGRFELLDAMPRLSSGKIDRKQLRARELAAPTDSGESDLPETEAQTALFATLNRLFPGQPLRRASDFFDDLGGHSLLAARLASSLRADPRYARITLRDIYRQRRLDRIAEAMADLSRQQTTPRLAFKISPALRRWTCGAAQAVAIPLLVALNMMQWLAPFFTYHFYTGDPDDSIPFAVLMSVSAYVAVTLLTFAVTIAGKWLVLGRARPGRYPLWGAMYFRWWLVDRLIDAAPSYLLPGSSLHALYLRALGAKVGRETNLASMSVRVPDLLSIGDYVNVGEAVNFENARVEGGELILGRIEVGDYGYVGSYAVMEGGCTIGEYGHLDALSALSENETIPPYRVFTGSPARDSGRFDPAQYPPRPDVSRLRLFGEALFFFAGAVAVSVLFFLPVFPSFALIDHFDNSDGPPQFLTVDGWLQLGKYFVFAFPASAVLIVMTALIAAGIRWAVLPRLRPGSWPVHSRVYLEKWLVNQIQENSLQVLHGVYATVFSPFWYRLLGAKVGRDAEISTAQGVVPDMLELGDDCFIADAVLLGDEEIDGGWMVLKPTVISPRSFVGNGAYVPDGTVLPENVLIGVHSRVPPNDQMQPGDTWLGSPPIRLPAREQTQGYAEALTFRPSRWRRLSRALVEAFRIVTPHAIVIAAGYGIVLNLMPAAAAEQWGDVVWGLTLSGLVFGLGAYAFVAALKWIFLGRYQKTSAPMWTWFVWSSEAVTNLYEGIAVPNFVRYLRGTPWLPLALNLLGARIGKGVYLDTTDITEFDCVTIGDYSELNALCGPQTHLFEDRVMKIDHVRIGSRVTIGPRSIVLYSASVGDDARLGALTLVMKGERIPDASDWQGCPAAPA